MIIYALLEPETEEVRYIGKTNNMKRRMYAHIYQAKKNTRNQYVYKWIRKVLANGKEPNYLLVEENLSETEAIEREKFWIKHYKDNGARLTNLNDGGLGFGLNNKVWVGKKHTEEYKQHMSRVMKGRTFTLESRLKISNARKTTKNNEDYRTKKGKLKYSKKVYIYDNITNEKLHEFNSILECSKRLGLNRNMMVKRSKSKQPYLNYLIEIGDYNGKET